MLDEIIEFLEIYKWIYDFKWTEISLIKPWDKSPAHWRQFFEKFEFDYLKRLIRCDFSSLVVSEDIQNFFLFHKKIEKLVSCRFDVIQSDSIEKWKKVNYKKCHEISNITSFLGQCITEDKSFEDQSEICVLDIGSGLGHLPRMLKRNLKTSHKISVIAVEGNPDLHNRNISSDNMMKLNFFITDANLCDFNIAVKSIYPKIDILTGLHCCGALSSNILKYFSTISCADRLLLLSCCYHRMYQTNLTGFPLSDIYQEKQKRDKLKFVTPMFLRLGCQESKETWLNWTEHDYRHHQYTVAFRSVIEQYSSFNDENFSALKRRKVGVDKCNDISFEDFVVAKMNGCHVKNEVQFSHIVSEQARLCRWYSVMLALQMALQQTIEYFILYDRILFLRQFGSVRSAELVRLFDPSISPRHIAILASK